MQTISEFILGCKIEKIRKYAIIAPCWMPDTVGFTDITLVAKGTCTIWDCRMGDIFVSYILSGVGACNCADLTMSLKTTKCERILFLGSAGALDESMRIGDFVIPQTVICGEGATRYMQSEIEKDTFGRCLDVDQEVYGSLFELCANQVAEYGVRCRTGIGMSVESIYSQFEHINEIKRMGCNCIDMEASAFLFAAQKIRIKAGICFCLSDNVVSGEPLMKVDPQKTAFRKQIRGKVLPYVIEAFFGESQ